MIAGDTLLTTDNPEFKADKILFKNLGINPKLPFEDGEQPVVNERYKENSAKAKMEARIRAWKKEMADK